MTTLMVRATQDVCKCNVFLHIFAVFYVPSALPRFSLVLWTFPDSDQRHNRYVVSIV